MTKLRLGAGLFAFALLLPGTLPAHERVAELGAAGASNACETRAHHTAAEVAACIRLPSLWRHLTQFQRIADANPGRLGHANRDTGTPGYRASVAYVAQLMRDAGYDVTVQRYPYAALDVVGTPRLRTAQREYVYTRDWFVAGNSGAGDVTAPVAAPRGGDGCALRDFAGFARGSIALVTRASCTLDAQVANARTAGASAVVLRAAADDAAPGVTPSRARLGEPASIPVLGFVSAAVATDLLQPGRFGNAARASLSVRLQRRTGIDENLIAESPFGDPQHTVVIDAHLDSIFGAGMLDNASGSTTILDVALAMAHTPTRNKLRYIWFGGEELGLLGSRYYTQHLMPNALRRIAFDVDVDVTATPNFDILIADPAFAHDVQMFPPNVVPGSKPGNDAFFDAFHSAGAISRAAPFGNDGTDSNSFSLVGVPNSGVLTQQDCCKQQAEVALWGGVRGNYEGTIPSFDGGCVDQPNRYCDNLSNNDPFVLELVSRAVGYVTFTLANAEHLAH